MKTVYYLVHVESDHRIRYYQTLTGARIACRLRNLHLGFLTRTEYEYLDHRTYEICTTAGDAHCRGTYCIEEDVIDTPDLLIDKE
jgi:hypothetical protein